MTFAVETLRSEPIRDATGYGGLRIAFEAWLGEVRVRMQLDVGFGNAIEPGAVEADYPVLLDAPAPRIRAYPPEAVVAEKLHAMVLLAERNSRMKDFYDVYVLATRFAFDGERLARAIAATFRRRDTEIGGDPPVALQATFYASADRARQWQAYLRRNALPGAPTDLNVVGDLLVRFLLAPWTALAAQEPFSDRWPPEGPWTPPFVETER